MKGVGEESELIGRKSGDSERKGSGATTKLWWLDQCPNT
jgi:hypothetical protein